MYKILFSREAQKDAGKLKKYHLEVHCQTLIELITQDPFARNPTYEKLVGDLKGFYSRRINRQHRLVYEVDSTSKTVKILRMWSHYE
jgi:toxin YoeB